MQSLDVPKRTLRVYPLKADDDIFGAFARYTYLTSEQAATVLGRKHDTIQKRLKTLYRAGYLNRVQASLIEPIVYFLRRGETRVRPGRAGRPALHHLEIQDDSQP